jgi:hypothetical protein
MDGNRWLVVALAVTAVVALIQSVQVERSTTYGLTRVLYRASSHAMADLAREGSAQMRDEFAFYVELRPYAEGGTVIVPRRPSMLERTAIRGLSGAELLTRDYDPAVGPGVARRLRDEASLTGTLSSSVGTVGVVGPSGPAALHVLLLDEGGTAYVVAADQLARHGIEPAGLALVGRFAEDPPDG